MAFSTSDNANQVGQNAGSDPKARVLRILISFSEQKYQEYARYRFAEEREWYEAALFYQRRQWLQWNDTRRRWALVKQNPNKPKPMPVTNYFAKAMNDNANQLQKVQIVATPNDDSDKNRRGAQYAEKSIDAIDDESGFDVLRPLLAKHVVLWGIGVTKDIFDTTAAGGQISLPYDTVKVRWMLSCADCGQTSEIPQGAGTPGEGDSDDGDQNATVLPGPSVSDNASQQPAETNAMPTGDQKCPNCGSLTTTPYQKKELVPAGTKQYTRGRLLTEIPSIFEIYLPRTGRNPNLAKCVVQRFRKGVGELRRQHPDTAKQLKADQPKDTHEIYIEALRSLVNYNYMHDQTVETTTVTETWADWDEVPLKVQDELSNYWADQPDQLEQAQNCGIFIKHSGGTMLAWGPNPLWGEKPFTFYLWELDPASTYPKGAAVDAIPIQKRLNRLDSLIELAMMSNAAGKWLWPKTQNGEKPTGSPSDVVAYDPIGDGKSKPEFVQPNPIASSAFQLRGQIVEDMQAISNALGVGQGQAPPGVSAFRAIAYLGSKADESQGTQRMLWELGNTLRYRKVVRMAAQYWNDDRKAKVAGFNGKYGMQMLNGELLQGDYEITFVADSSRPRLIGEKQQALAAGLQAGLIDPTDSAVREYIVDILRLDPLNLVGHLQYLKAERDLEALKSGTLPRESPFQDWQIFLKVFANFTLTEEFEALPQPTQQLIIVYTQSLSDKLAAATQPAAPAGPPVGALAAAAGKAIGALGGKGHNPLAGVPGQTTSAPQVQGAAGAEGEKVAAALP